jgi:hypothetical protein
MFNRFHLMLISNLIQRALIASLVICSSTFANEPISKTELDNLAKDLTNPVADLITAPFEYNHYGKLGPNQQGTSQTLTFQPVIPQKLTSDYNLIWRPNFTFTHLNNVNGVTNADVAPFSVQTFFAPSNSTDLIWGIGPYAAAPTGSSGYFGSHQWGGGVSAVVLKQTDDLTVGLLGVQSWSLGGNPNFGTTNNISGRPFIAYVTKNDWIYDADLTSLYNYDLRRTSNLATAGISKLMMIKDLPISVGGGAGYYLSSFPGGPQGWVVKATVSFIFPGGSLWSRL